MEFLAVANEADWLTILLRTGSMVIGLGLLWAAIMAAAGVMLVPRPSSQKLALLVGQTCHFVFKAIAMRAKNYVQLDRVLAVQGPTTVLLYLALFLLIFVGAFAFLFYGVTGCSPSEAFYRSGSSMSTLGVVTASGFETLTVMFVGAFTGTTVISVFIGFLLTLYSAYTARETYMSKMAMLCGEPGWGPETVVRLHKLQTTMDAGEAGKCVDWICAMRVSQYIYPLLNHFRSPVRDRHWAVSLLSILDAAAIRIAAIDSEPNMDLLRILAQGADALHALKLSEISRTSGEVGQSAMITWIVGEKLLRMDENEPTPDPGITREEWDEAMRFLAFHGVTLKPETDAAWKVFCHIRSQYVEPAYFLSHHLSAVNAPWSGPRHPAFEFPLIRPLLAREFFAGACKV
jgi:hypothetical protein